MLRALVLAVVALAGCGAQTDARSTLLVDWRFADGRRCVESGASVVVVSSDAAGAEVCAPVSCQFACLDGEGAPGVTLTVSAGGATLRFAAQSPQGAALYRGDLALEGAIPAAATALLFFSGGP